MAEHQTHEFQGRLPDGIRVAVVVSRYNTEVTSRLLDGTISTLREHGIGDDRTTIADVPGAFEIPLAADTLAKSGKYAAVICLGAVIQGETDHHEYINQSVAKALMRIGLDTGVPVSFGVLTCKSQQQAMDRAGGKVGNKGEEAALAALEMVSLLSHLDDSPAAY